MGLWLEQVSGSAAAGDRPALAWGRRRWGLVGGGIRLERPRRDYVVKFALVLATYYAAAQVGYTLRFAGPVAAFVWLPAGAGIALLYLLGPGLWPAVVLGDLLVNDYATLPFGSALGQSFGNLLEVLCAALLLRRFASRRAPLGSIGGLFDLLLALVAATALSATIGLASLLAGHVVELASVPRLWRTWLLGDLSGALIIVPLAIAWFSGRQPVQLAKTGVEPVLLTITLLGLITLAWRADITLYYALGALIWAAVRFGLRGASLAVAIGSAFTIWTTTHVLGPFSYHTLGHGLLNVQAYLVVSAVTTLAAAVLVEEHSRLTAGLRASRARIVSVADEERRRIERNLHDGAQQRLVALAAHLSLAANEARTDPASAAEEFDGAQVELQLAIDDLRELAHGIRPPALRKFGLATAIRLAAARSSAELELDLDGLPGERMDDAVEATAYYLVLEGITNAERYARASRIQVDARLVGRSLVLEIADDGVGGAIEQDSLGLQGLRDRVEAVGGEFALESARSVGTRIAARIPVRAGHGRPQPTP